jgi:hypothetical protein
MMSVLGEGDRGRTIMSSETQYFTRKCNGVIGFETRKCLDLTSSKTDDKFLNDGEHVFCFFGNSAVIRMIGNDSPCLEM